MQEEKKKSRKEGDKARLAAAAARLGVLQRRLKDEKIPVIITFDGFDAAGKGLQISRLIQALDPRGFDVYTGDRDGEEEAMHLSLIHICQRAINIRAIWNMMTGLSTNYFIIP